MLEGASACLAPRLQRVGRLDADRVQTGWVLRGSWRVLGVGVGDASAWLSPRQQSTACLDADRVLAAHAWGFRSVRGGKRRAGRAAA